MRLSLASTVFATVDHLTTQLGPINTLVNVLVDRIAPHATAKACGPASGCGACQCTTDPCGLQCCSHIWRNTNYERCLINSGSFPCSNYCYRCPSTCSCLGTVGEVC